MNLVYNAKRTGENVCIYSDTMHKTRNAMNKNTYYV